MAHLGEFQGAGAAVNEGDAKNHYRRGSGAQDEILDPGLNGPEPILLKTSEHIKRDGNEFHRHKQHHKARCSSSEEHAGQGETGKRVHFADA